MEALGCARNISLFLLFKNFNFATTLHVDQIAVTLFLGLGLIKALSGLRDAVITAKVHTVDGTVKYSFSADPAEDLRVQGQAFTGQTGFMNKEKWATDSGQINSLQGTLDTDFFNIFMLRRESVVEFWTGIAKPEKRKAPFSIVKTLSFLVQFAIVIAIFLVPEQYRSFVDIVLVAGNVMGLIQCFRPGKVNFSVKDIDTGKELAQDSFQESATKPVRAKTMGRAGQKGKRDGANYSDERGWLKGLCKTDVHKEFNWFSLSTENTIVFHVRPGQPAQSVDNSKKTKTSKKKRKNN